jgi:hypothetical protein
MEGVSGISRPRRIPGMGYGAVSASPAQISIPKLRRFIRKALLLFTLGLLPWGILLWVFGII